MRAPSTTTGRAAVVDLERVVGRAGEVGGEVDEEVGVGAGVAVDDLVVVADAEHVVARARRRAARAAGARGGGPGTRRRAGAGTRVARAPRSAGSRQSASTAPRDLPVEVDRVVVFETVAVVLVHRGEAFDVAALRARRARGSAGRAAPLRALRGRAGARRCWRGTSASRAARCARGSRVRRRTRTPGPGAAHDLVAERVERADLAAARRREGRRGGPASRRPHAGCRRARTRSRRRSRARPPGAGTGPSSTVVLPEPAGARMRAGPPAVQHGGALIGREPRPRPPLAAARRRVGGRAPRCATRCTTGASETETGGARTAVAPRRCAVGEEHVGRTPRRRAEPLRFRCRTPARRAVARVVVVGAHEEVAALTREVEGGRELVRRAVVALGRAQLLTRRRAGRRRPACVPTTARAAGRPSLAGRRSTASSTTTRVAVGPRLGRGRARLDDDAAPERGRARQARHAGHRRARLRRRPASGGAGQRRVRGCTGMLTAPLRLRSTRCVARVGARCWRGRLLVVGFGQGRVTTSTHVGGSPRLRRRRADARRPRSGTCS